MRLDGETKPEPLIDCACTFEIVNPSIENEATMGVTKAAPSASRVSVRRKLHIWLFPSDEVFAAAEVYPKALRGEDAPPVHLDRLTWLPELSSIALSTSIGEVKLISYDVAAWRSRGQKVFVSK